MQTARTLFLLIFFIFISISLQAQCGISVSAGEDQYTCLPPTPVQLEGSIGGDYLSFTWSPTTGMSGSNTLTPTVNVSQTTTYVLTVKAVDLNNNLIQNGNFEQGNSSFESEYTYSPGNLWPEGVYEVTSDPQASHANFASCGDHTSGDGNMLAVNGAATPSLNVWCQTVDILPNTQYVFSTWVTTLVASSPAQLQFSINGANLGSIFSAPSATCIWQRFYTIWNSGASTTANICIVNQNTQPGGNDFALDDILFSPICTITDTVVVRPVPVTAVAAPVTVNLPCEGAVVNLNGTGSSTGTNITYEWTAGPGNIVSGENTLMPSVNSAGTYTLTVKAAYPGGECEKTATVNVIPSPNQLTAWINTPPLLGCGITQTLLFGNATQTGFMEYQWTANPGNIVGAANTKNVLINAPGNYTLSVINTMTGCTATADVTVSQITNPPVSNAVGGILTCTQKQVTLLSTGSSSGANITYNWTTSNGTLIGPTNGTTALAVSSGTYILAVTNTTNQCTRYDTVQVISNNTAPTLNIQPPGILTCIVDTIKLTANVNPTGVNLTWSGPPLAGPNNTANTTTVNPGMYTLSAVDPTNGCTATSSVTVPQNINPPTAIVQPAPELNCQTTTVTLSAAGTSTGTGIHYRWITQGGGHIVSGDTTLAPVVDKAGTYVLIVYNSANGCTDTTSLTVNQNTALPNAQAAGGTLTCTQSQVQLSSSGSSTGSTFSYSWTTPNGSISGPANGPTALTNTTGDYILAVTNTTNMCTTRDTVKVDADLQQPNLSIATPAGLNCAVASVPLQASISPANSSIVWTAGPGAQLGGPTNAAQTSATAPGTYTATAVNPANGCSTTLSATVNQDITAPAVSVQPAPMLTCVQPSVTLSASSTPSGSEVNYQWTTADGNLVNGDKSVSPLVNAAGTYIIVATNTLNHCTASASVSVSADASVIKAVASAPDTIDCVTSSIQLSSNGSTAGTGITYSWTASNGGTLLGDPASASPMAASPGLYTLVLTNTANGCTATDLAIVTENKAKPIPSIAAPGLLTCASPSQILKASASGSGAYLVSWSTSNGNILNGDKSFNPEINAAGTYQVVVTDLSNGCTASANTTVDLAIGTPMAVTLPAPELTCAQPVQSLNATGSSTGPEFEYAWTTGNGHIVSGLNSLTPSVDKPGTYSLTVTNKTTGCTATAEASLSENKTAPQAEAGSDGLLTCLNQSVSLTANANLPAGNLLFKWTTTDGQIISPATQASINVDKEGTYLLTVTDPVNGCSSSDQAVVVTDRKAPTLQTAAPAVLTCTLQETQLQITASGSSLSYVWTTPDGSFVGPNNLATPTVNAPGKYLLTVTDGANGCTSTTALDVSQDVASPQLSINPPATLTCIDKVIKLTAQNALPGSNFNYTWSASTGGNIVSGNTTLTPSVDKPGNYTLSATNTNNGCTAGATVNVQQNISPPSVSAGLDALITCKNPSATLQGAAQGQGMLQIIWTAGNGGQIVPGVSDPLSPVATAAGSYILEVIDAANGCSASDVVNVNADQVFPLANAGQPLTLTCNLTQAKLSATGSTGSKFEYDWSTTNGLLLSGKQTLTPTVGAPGQYTLTVTNTENGCEASSSVLIAQDTVAPVVNAGAPVRITCAHPTPSLQASASGNALDLSWTTVNGTLVSGIKTLSPIIAAPGLYTLTAQNTVNGCMASSQVSAGIDTTSPVPVIAKPAILTCTQTAVPLVASLQQPISQSALTWTTANGHFTTGQTSMSPTVDKPGVYTLTINNTDNGCSSAVSTTVTQDTVKPLVVIAPAALLTCNAPGQTLNATASSAGPGINYQWTASAGGAIVSGSTTTQPVINAAGNYNLTVTNTTNGCTANRAVTVGSDFNPPSVNLTPPLPLTCVRDTVIIPASATGSVTVNWTTTNGALAVAPSVLSPKVTAPGLYTLTATNTTNGCTAVFTSNVFLDNEIPDVSAGPTGLLHCQQLQLKLTGSSTTPGPLSFAWHTDKGHFSGPTTVAAPTADAPGVYTLTVTNLANGCTASDTTSVTRLPLPAFSFTAKQPNCLIPTGIISFTDLKGGAAPFLYSISSGSDLHTTPTFEKVKPGSYTLVVEDAYGCTASAGVTLKEPVYPNIKLTDVMKIAFGDSILLSPLLNLPLNGITKWEWTPSERLSCADCPTPYATPFTSTRFTLKVTDINGCIATASTEIHVDRSRSFYAPNIFSPDGDGQNDFFNLFGKGIADVEWLSIFDRWGNNVSYIEHLKINDETTGWDGIFRNQPVNPGVFVWMAHIRYIDGETVLVTGDVTVLR